MRTTYRASKVITLIVTCLGFFMVLLDTSIVNVALPTIQADLLAASQSWWLLFPSHGSAHRLLASGRASPDKL